MSDNNNFYKIAENFGVFALCSEDDVDYLKSIYKDKEKLRENLKNMIVALDEKLKSVTKTTLFCLLTDFLFEKCKEIKNIEICSIYSIFWDTMRLSFRKHSKKEIFDFFKKSIIRHSMDRPPYQIGILTKETIDKITNFFVDNIYMRFELLKYMMCKKKNIEVVNKDLLEIKLPHILDLDLAVETNPRKIKILKQYTENRKPKTELEQKIEMILDLERENLDKKLDDKFAIQDQVFNKKIEELIGKKKK